MADVFLNKKVGLKKVILLPFRKQNFSLMAKKALKYLFYLVLAGVIIIQFFRIDKSNPPIDEINDYYSLAQPPAEVAQLLEVACNDCHSHSTKYPWYTNIAPVSWWVKDHIDHGREHFNFSLFGTYPAKRAAHKMEEAYEEIEGGHMPLPSYLRMHPEARLSEDQKDRLIAWFKAEELRWQRKEEASSSTTN